jgi:hypothetical protein
LKERRDANDYPWTGDGLKKIVSMAQRPLREGHHLMRRLFTNVFHVDDVNRAANIK